MKKTPKKTKKKLATPPKKGPLKSVVVSSTYMGKSFKGIKIYYEGKTRPRQLKVDGLITMGKDILETLQEKLKKYRLIITEDKNEIVLKNGIYQVRMSGRTLDKLFGEKRTLTKDVKTDILRKFLPTLYPGFFKSLASVSSYRAGALSKVLTDKSESILPKLSSADREGLMKFLPIFLATEAHNTVNLLKADAQITSLKGLADDLEKELDASRSESWWQGYIQRNILLIQQGYIKAIPKINISIGNTKFPDFSLVTHDSYLDILEIKRPTTVLLKFDASHNNYYWDSEISKAISQLENYITNVSRFADSVRSYIKDEHGIDLQVLKPRGVLIVGDTRKFSEQKMKDDFRLLAQSHKNITVVTYNELHTRLNNYIHVLEENRAKKK